MLFWEPEVSQEDREKFIIGDRVKIVCDYVDSHFFRIGEMGTVIENKKCYLGITVKFDNPHPIEYASGARHIQEVFNFEPHHIELVERGGRWRSITTDGGQ